MTDEKIVKDLLSCSPCPEMKSYSFWKCLVASRRYGKVRMNYFASSFNGQNPEQFAAATFFLEDGRFIVSFRGTDSSYIGWREDFDMAVFDVVPSQKRPLLI